MILLHIKVDEALKQEIERVSKERHFASMTEFVRDAIRKSLEDYRAQHALELINKKNLRAKSGARPSRSERAKAVDELFELKKLARNNR